MEEFDGHAHEVNVAAMTNQVSKVTTWHDFRHVSAILRAQATWRATA
jgi:hypothetical protein